ncbi:MAG: tRNA 2-thiouridine(34) synthase MnmA, partial [Clostridia bacterium]|nr:tRNA 2-thiouridine(34) synthase MnmA [Clostridia bacterium]
LKQDGYEVAGMNCRFFCEDEALLNSGDDTKDADAVCKKLDIPFFVSDLRKEFDDCVIEDFLTSYEKGATPNPCVCCNKHMKFDLMLKKAEENGYDNIATGHYAIIEKDQNGRFLLKKGADIGKDQSYVLYVLNQHQLSHSLFPLGGLCKSEIREIAENMNFINANRKDSQDICFVPDGDYAAFIERRTGKTYPDGNFVTRDGKILGTHKGIIRYTVGQRKGLGLALPAPMYVCEKDVQNNRVILSDNETLFTKTLTAKSINLIPFDKIDSSMRLKAKVRYKHQEQWATVHQTDDDTLFVEFDEPVRAIAKGQSLVMYDGDYVVGGGIIE